MNKEHPMPPDECYKPTFIKGDKVKLKKTAVSYAKNHELIKDKELIVDKTNFKDWGDGITSESVYFIEQEGVRNPYLTEHFKKV